MAKGERQNKMNHFINANSIHIPLADKSVNTVVTSPPYFNLRDYGIGEGNGEIGSENSIDEYVSKIVNVFREVKRVLRDDGTIWIVIGDSYAGSWKGGNSDVVKSKKGQPEFKNKGKTFGLKPKDLIGIPWMVAFALRNDGWYLRRDIIWHKLNPMPESVKDRCTSSHETIFFMSKSKYYFYDHEAIKEPSKYPTDDRGSRGNRKRFPTEKINGIRSSGIYPMRNKRDVWSVCTSSYPGAHFAVYPEKLIIDCIKAGSPIGGIVLDVFSGAGTTGIVCKKLDRKFIGIELNKNYLKLSKKRLEQVKVGEKNETT